MTPPGIRISALGRDKYPAKIVFDKEHLSRADENPDARWYEQPRFVQHIDDGAIFALKSYYGEIIKPENTVLDLCTSWTSHLPPNLRPQRMIGIGLNRQEMERNEHLTSSMVRDLNAQDGPREAFKGIGDEEVDVVICSVSVDYLTKPVQVFGEMWRVLKPGGTAHMAFSNRCFPTKVIGKWMRMDDEERRAWVGGYFWASGDAMENEGGWESVEEVILKEEKSGSFLGSGAEDPLYVVRGKKST